MSQFEPAAIGQRIAQARHEAGGMTQEELSDLLGVTTRSVQGYEAGDVVPWRHFQRLEEIFKRPLEWFLHDAEEEEAIDAVSLDRRLGSLEGAVAELASLVRRALELLDEPRADEEREPRRAVDSR